MFELFSLSDTLFLCSKKLYGWYFLRLNRLELSRLLDGFNSASVLFLNYLGLWNHLLRHSCFWIMKFLSWFFGPQCWMWKLGFFRHFATSASQFIPCIQCVYRCIGVEYAIYCTVYTHAMYTGIPFVYMPCNLPGQDTLKMHSKPHVFWKFIHKKLFF